MTGFQTPADIGSLRDVQLMHRWMDPHYIRVRFFRSAGGLEIDEGSCITRNGTPSCHARLAPSGRIVSGRRGCWKASRPHGPANDGLPDAGGHRKFTGRSIDAPLDGPTLYPRAFL